MEREREESSGLLYVGLWRSLLCTFISKLKISTNHWSNLIITNSSKKLVVRCGRVVRVDKRLPNKCFWPSGEEKKVKLNTKRYTYSHTSKVIRQKRG